MNTLNNKKIGIFGLGITGKSIYSYLTNYADNIICWDDSDINRNNFSNQNILVNLNDPKWKSLNIIFISPGISDNHPTFLLAKQHNIPISSDIELFLHHNANSKIIAITGTNGKSTTTSMIGHILYNNGYDFTIGGNIGIPVLSLPKNNAGYILELSSFQLRLLKHFNPAISVLLNITPDHLDLHGDFDSYCKAKMQILNGDGIKIIGTEEDICQEIYSTLLKNGEKKIIAITSQKQKNSINCDENYINDYFYDDSSYQLLPLPNLPGEHNKQNIAASYAVCRALGLTANAIISYLTSFQGLTHRMQNLGTENNITYYNDSKATNTYATAKALDSLQNIFWLAGGLFKEESLDPLEKSLINVKKAYLFGESTIFFAKYLKNRIDFEIFDNIEDAFYKAESDAKKQKEPTNIVLSPACASYDQFRSFEERGNKFINLYNEKL